jgi:carboxymethylenebutenolidase
VTTPESDIVHNDAVIPTPAGLMRALVARPAGRGSEGPGSDGSGPFPVVITYPHVGGLTSTMRLMAGRVAAGGYACVVPDLYHRLGTIVIDPQSDDADVVAIRRIAAASVTDGNAMADTAALLGWLAAQPDLNAASVGAVGYGRGGALAIRAAAEFSGRVRAAASVLGFGFTADGIMAARHRLARITGGLYFAFAEHDDIIPAVVPAEVAALLRDLPIDARLVVHQGARHPYVFPDRAVHDPAAAERDWEAIFAMYARHLSSTF